MAGRRRSPDFECADGDFEGDLAGAMHHAELTGHSLTKETLSGTTITVGLDVEDDEEEDEPYDGYMWGDD